MTGITFNLIGTQLLVTGTAGDDDIQIASNNGDILIDAQTQVITTGYTTSQVNSIRILGEDGNDTLSTEEALSLVPLVLEGGMGHDTLYGGDAADTLYGGDGDDTIIGGGGDDTIQGDSGADTLDGQGDDDTIYGGDGNDTIHGGDGDDGLHGELGADIIHGDAGADGIHGGLGNDTLYGGTGNDTLKGNEDNDSLHGGTGDDYLYGGDGNDTLRGDEDTDVILSEGGADDVDGGAGNDHLKLDGLDQPVLGGTGRDRADVDDSAGVGITIGVNGSIEDFFGSSFVDHFDATMADEGVVAWGYGGNDVLIGSPFADTLQGGLDDDQLFGHAGDDNLQGEDGNDTIYGHAGIDGLNGGPGNDDLYGGSEGDTLNGKEGADTLYGDSGDDWLFGGDNNDMMYGGDGNDIMRGELGDDTLAGEGDNDNIAGRAGNDTITGGPGNDVLYGDEDNDTIYGGDGNDTLYGGDGDDGLHGELGADIIHGDAGADGIHGGLGSDTLYGGTGNDTLKGNEDNDSLHGGTGDDYLYGGDGNDTLRGDEDTDVILSEGGADDVDGGAGNDHLKLDGLDQPVLGGTGRDRADVDDSAGVGITIGVNGSIEDFFGSSFVDHFDATMADEGVVAWGYGGNDVLIGSPFADTLQGGLDDDQLFGHAGDDNLQGEDGNDTIYGHAGIDGLNGGPGNDDLYGGSEGDTLNGKEGADTLYGDSGDDWLFGGDNNDMMYGGDGNDIMRGELGDDTLAGEGGNDNIAGRAGNDTITGGPGNDVLYGDEGNDTIHGGDDNDVLYIDEADSGVTGGLGIDEVDAQNAIGAVTLVSSSLETIRGSSFDDHITIHDADGTVVVYGNAGDDSFYLAPLPSNVLTTVYGGAGSQDLLTVLEPFPETSTKYITGPESGWVDTTGGYGDIYYYQIPNPIVQSKNLPPLFTSVPIAEASVGSSYHYESTATDGNGDSLTFYAGTVTWPDGFEPTAEQQIQFQYINNGVDQRGVYTWNPPAELAGQSVIVEEFVTDGINDPVQRVFEIRVNAIPGNSPPIITSQPDESYQLPSVVASYNNPYTAVTPGFVSVVLADGQEFKVNVSIDPADLGTPTADVVFAIDATASMDGAVTWLTEQNADNNYQSTLEQIENELQALGITGNRYGLVVYKSGALQLPYTGGLAIKPFAIAVGNVDTTLPPAQQPEALDRALAASSDELWGTIEQLRIAVESINTDGDWEVGYHAIERILDPTPHGLQGPQQQFPYQMRGEATVNIINVSDDVSKEFDLDMQSQITEAIVNDETTSTDDIVFTSVVMARFAADLGENQGPFDVSDPNAWEVGTNNLRFTPAPSVNTGTAIFDVHQYTNDLEIPVQGRTIPYLQVTFLGWSASIDMEIHDLGSSYDQSARIVFGPDQLTAATNFPAEYWYLEADARSDVWEIVGPNGQTYAFQLHSGVSWPDIQPDAPISAELRLIAIPGSTDFVDHRFDLFIDGMPIGSQLIPDYKLGGTTAIPITQDTIAFLGFEAENSSISIDSVELSAIDHPYDHDYWHDVLGIPLQDPTGLPPTAPTPKDFQNPQRGEVARRGFIQDFGSEDGFSHDERIVGIDLGGAAYRLNDNGIGFQRLENPNWATAEFYQGDQYISLSSAVSGSVWNLGLLRTNQSASELQAFSEALAETIAKDSLLSKISARADSPLVTNIAPVFDPANPALAAYELTLTGNGSAESFEVEFLQHASTVSVIGSIPVWVDLRYSHDFEVTDAESDVPYAFAFDPTFVDDNGDLITHGAQLVDSGRENLIGDRLIWDPPQVTQETEFPFRVIVRDAAGQVGRKAWTVTVYPEVVTNSLPQIVPPESTDDDDTDGFINEPLLPSATELRNYHYQVEATDGDLQDRDNLRYFLAPTVLSDGSQLPIPSWLTIDRNTGVLSGRPGSNAVGSTHITVVVNDGRLYENASGAIVAGSTEQVFKLTVNPRTSINVPPVITRVDDLAVRVDQRLDLKIDASDGDGDGLSYRLLTAPAGMVIDSTSGLISWVPGTEHIDQIFPVTVSVSDGRASDNESFQIYVAGLNRPPKITTEMPATWDGHMTFQVPLTAEDPDGNVLSFAVTRMPVGMLVEYVDGIAHLTWNHASITPGRHRISIRAFDGVGGLSERDYDIDFYASTAPIVDSIVQPVWRETTTGTATIRVKSFTQDSIAFAIDSASQQQGLSLGTASSVQINDAALGNYWQYEIPLNWTPEYQGQYELQFSATNSSGTTTESVSLSVYADVTDEENQAPVFADGVLGPFEKDAAVYLPLEVFDPEGHAFTLTAVAGTSPLAINGNTLSLDTSEPGLYTITLRADEIEGVLAIPKSAEHTYTYAVLENATPAILYVQPNRALVDAAYQFDFDVIDVNAEDTVEVSLGAEAAHAGVVLSKVTGESTKHRLDWAQDKIAAWAGNQSLPASLPISVVVTDNHGANSRIHFDLPVRDPSLPASFPGPYTYRLSANRAWSQQFKVDNPGGLPLSFSLTEATDSQGNLIPLPTGMTISFADGVMTWHPSADLLYNGKDANGKDLPLSAERTFELNVSVNVDNTNTFIQPVTVTVVDPAIFFPYVPEVDTSVAPPPNAAVIGEALIYQPALKPIQQPEHASESVTWSLEDGPQGMIIDVDTGRVTWTPEAAQLGQPFSVTILPKSSQGAGMPLTFVLDTVSTNSPPLFATTFPTVWQTGTPLKLDVHGHDREGHSLAYELLSATSDPLPADLTMDNGQGIINWPAPTAGQQKLLVRVYERHNPDSMQERTFTLNVVDPAVSGSPVNLEPLIQGAPHGMFAHVGSEFLFDFEAQDPDQAQGVALTYALEGATSASATIGAQDGVFRWTPQASEEGTHSFRISVTDTSPHAGVANNTRFLTFQLIATDNDAPQITSTPSINTFVQTSLVHQVEANDEDGDAITYHLEGAPDGMTIDPATGLVRWQVADAENSYQLNNVVIVATDPFGASASQILLIDVSTADAVPPTISFYLKDGSGKTIPPTEELTADQFEDYDLWVEVRDNRGINLPGSSQAQNGSWYLSALNTGANEVSVGVRQADYIDGLDPGETHPRHGLWKIDLTGSGLNQGTLEIEIEAYDQAGNVVTRQVRYYVNDPAAHDIGKILNLNENSPPITDRFEVRGNALWTSDGIGTYDLRLTSMEDPNDFVYLAKNKPATVSGSLIGVVDGTMIPTGQYRLYLEVRCSESCEQAVDERIIEVQNEARLGNLDLAFSDLQVTLGGVPIPMIRTYSSGLVGEVIDADGKGAFPSDFSPGWNLNLLQSKVSVSHPDGVTMAVDQAFAEGTRVFVSLPNGSVHRFTFDPLPLGGVFVPQLTPDPEFKSSLYLAEYDPNLRFVLNQERGDGTYVTTGDNRESIPSNFGSAWILQTEDGLKYVFDIRTGLLTSIEDQNQARIDIDRQAGGDVVLTTHNTGFSNADGATVTEEVVIRRELKPLSPSADPQYRITALVDPIVEGSLPADDLQVTYTYDAGQNLSEVRARDGQTTGYEYNNTFLPNHLTDILDNDSQVIFHADYFDDLDEDGSLEDAERDDERFARLRSTSNANGDPTHFDFTLDLGDGRKVRSTNTAGIAVEEVVNGRGDVLRVVRLVGDSTVDAEKRYLVTVTRYNLRGLVTAQSKPFYVTGVDNRFSEQPPEPHVDALAWASLTTYDDQGRVLTVSDATGAATTNTYDDKLGIQTSTDAHGVTRYQITDPANGRLLETYTSPPGTSERFNYIRYQYNDFGQQTHQREILPDGTEVLLSESFYDSKGFLVWSQQAQSPKQFYAYDNNGQQTHSWYNLQTSDTPATYLTVVDYSHTEYAGPSNLDAGADGLQSARFEIRGTVEYNETNVAALRTKVANFASDADVTRISEVNTLTNARDLVVQTRNLSVDSSGNEFWYVTRTVYDSQGRVEYQTDSYREDTPPADITGVRNAYDAEGRIEKVERLRGLAISVTPSGTGKGESAVANQGTVQSYTETSFDDLGRVASTTQYSTSSTSSGLTTTSVYNRQGLVTETRREAWNAAGTGTVVFRTRTVYDVRGRVEWQTDEYLDGETVFATKTLYDGADRAYGTERWKGVVIDLDPNTHETTFNGSGALKLTQTASYYDLDRVERSVDALGSVTQYEYDDLGRQSATIGPRVMVGGVEVRHRTETVYDERGRVKTQRANIVHQESGNHDESQVQETSYEYDTAGNAIRTVYADGSFAQSRYDAQGRVVAESKQVAAGTQLSWSEADGSFRDDGASVLVPTRTMQYDSEGRLIEVELPGVADPQNSSIVTRPSYRYGYDEQGQQTLVADPYDRETRLDYNALGHQITRTLPLEFGANGYQETGGDDAAPGSFSETFEYDQRGRQTLHVSFEGVHTVHVYDDVTGRMTEIQYFEDAASYNNGTGTPDEKRVFSFDDRGRVWKVEHFVGTSVVRTETTTYHEQGWIEGLTSEEGVIEYAYDVHGRVTKRSHSGTDFVSSPSNPFDNEVQYTYDALGRLASVKQVHRGGVCLATPEETTYTYDLTGNLDTTTYANGLIHDYEYDELGRLDALYHWVDEDGDNIRDTEELRADIDYTLRADGKRTGASEKFWDENGSILAERTTTWDYDAADRVISEIVSDLELDEENYTLTWTYDLVGNRVSQTKTDDVGTESTSYEYDANDRLKRTETWSGGSLLESVDFTYDQTQQTSKTTTDDYGDTTVQDFEYDLQGRLAKVETGDGVTVNSTVEYEYDSAGNRVASTTTTTGTSVRTEFLTDPQNPTGYSQVLQETEFDTSGASPVPTQKVIYAVGHDQISQTVYTRVDTNSDGTPDAWDSGQTHTFGTDGHGSVRVLYDLAAAIVNNGSQLFHYDAYGNLVGSGWAEPGAAQPLTRYLYSGESFDFGTGQQYLRARWYDPHTGRFNRLDDFAGNNQDPQSFHKYAYVHGDPIQMIDPTGKFGLAAGLARAGAISLGAATLLPAIRGGYLSASNIAQRLGNESIFSFAFLGSLGWNDWLTIAGGFGDGLSAGAYNALDTLTLRQISPVNKLSTSLWDGQALSNSWVGSASNTLAWAGTTALYSATAVWTWGAAGGGTMNIAVSRGASPWFIHVRYGANGLWEHAVLGTGRSGLGGMTIVSDVFAGAGGVQITGIPVLLPQNVLLGAATTETACSCVTAAIRAFLRGWGI